MAGPFCNWTSKADILDLMWHGVHTHTHKNTHTHIQVLTPQKLGGYRVLTHKHETLGTCSTWMRFPLGNWFITCCAMCVLKLGVSHVSKAFPSPRVSSIPNVHRNAGPEGSIEPYPQAAPFSLFPLGHRIKGFGALQIAETNRRSFQIGTKAEAERTHREDGGLMIKMSDDYQEWLIGGFLKWGYPKVDGLSGKIPSTNGCGGYPYFRKPPISD